MMKRPGASQETRLGKDCLLVARSLLAEVSYDEANETTGERPLPASDEFSITHALAFP